MQDAIVIIGGGLAGLSTAFELVKHTQDKIILIEAQKLGSVCTGKAAGLLTPATEVHLKDDPFLNIVNMSLQYYTEFVHDLTHHHPNLVDYRQNGNLLCAFDSDGERDLLRTIDFKKNLSFQIEKLSREELKQKEPLLAQRIQTAYLAVNEACIDPVALVKKLKEELSASTHCQILENTRVTKVAIHNNKISFITLSNGNTIATRQVVLASGLKHDIPEIKARFPLPLRPVKGQMVCVQLPEKTLQHPVQIYHRYSAYLCPRANGEVLIGSTAEERGDEDVTAGAVMELLHAAWQVLPILAEHKLVKTWAGLRPTTPDNYPVAGLTNIDNLFCALGFYRKGILLSPYFGQQLARLMLGKSTEMHWNAIRYDRF